MTPEQPPEREAVIPAIAELKRSWDIARINIPIFEKQGGIWKREAASNRQDIEAFKRAIKMLKKATR